MRALLVVTMLLVSGASLAADQKSRVAEILDSMPPMSEAQREAFDKAARAMYDPSCDCLTFLMGNEVIKLGLPLSDSDRRLLILSLEKKIIIPLDGRGAAH